MYLIDKVREKAAKGAPIVGANTVLSDASISEMFGLAGCDYVWIDMEHGSLSQKEVEQHIMGCHAGGTAAFVRVPWNDQVMVKRVLDIVAHVVVLVFAVVVTYYGIKLLGIVKIQRSPMLRISMAYFYASVPFSGALLGVKAVFNLIHYLTGGEHLEPID